MANIAPSHKEGVQKTHHEPMDSMLQVKLDIKAYPTFNGQLSEWLKFKHQVLAVGSTHGLDTLFEVAYSVPVDGTSEFEVYERKNKFLYSVWISRITGGQALSIVRKYETTKDGRGVFLEFRKIYESIHNMEQVSLLALQAIESLTFTYRFPGGIPAFTSKFRDQLLNLADAGEPMSTKMAKSLFLSKIQDKDY